MSKPYSADDFTSLVVSDRTWRIKEISDLKTAIKRSDDVLAKVLLRALVTISYAHWEGHVRNSARLYLTHIALRKYSFSSLKNQFMKNQFLSRLTNTSLGSSNLAKKCDIIEEIISSSDKRFSHFNDELVNTKSNLNSDVFFDICLVCGLRSDDFEEYKTFIDSILLKRRNSIAHGEDTFVAREDIDDISQKTITLMRLFGEALDNNVQMKLYLAA